MVGDEIVYHFCSRDAQRLVFLLLYLMPFEIVFDFCSEDAQGHIYENSMGGSLEVKCL